MMNKNRKIALTAAIIAVIVIASTLSIYCLTRVRSTSHPLPQGEPPQAQVKITGDIQTEKTLN